MHVPALFAYGITWGNDADHPMRDLIVTYLTVLQMSYCWISRGTVFQWARAGRSLKTRTTSTVLSSSKILPLPSVLRHFPNHTPFHVLAAVSVEMALTSGRFARTVGSRERRATSARWTACVEPFACSYSFLE